MIIKQKQIKAINELNKKIIMKLASAIKLKLYLLFY